MKYLVVAVKWDSEKCEQVKYIAGQFDSYFNAELFRNAYNNNFKANAKIIEVDKLINC